MSCHKFHRGIDFPCCDMLDIRQQVVHYTRFKVRITYGAGRCPEDIVCVHTICVARLGQAGDASERGNNWPKERTPLRYFWRAGWGSSAIDYRSVILVPTNSLRLQHDGCVHQIPSSSCLCRRPLMHISPPSTSCAARGSILVRDGAMEQRYRTEDPEFVHGAPHARVFSRKSNCRPPEVAGEPSRVLDALHLPVTGEIVHEGEPRAGL